MGYCRVDQSGTSKYPGLGLVAKDLPYILILLGKLPHHILDLDFDFTAPLLRLLKKGVEGTVAHPEHSPLSQPGSPSLALPLTRHFYRYIYLERL